MSENMNKIPTLLSDYSQNINTIPQQLVNHNKWFTDISC